MYKYKFIPFLLIAVFVIFGCDASVLGPSLGNNLFPLTAGNKFEYKMVDLDSNQSEIPETARSFTREIGFPVYVDGYLASPIYETYFNFNNSIIGRDTLYVYKSPADDTISYYIKITVPLTETSSITINKWAPVFLRQWGSDYRYTFFDSTVKITNIIGGVEYPMSLTVTLSNLTGSITKIAVSENSDGYRTNRLSLNYIVKQGGAAIREGDFYRIWLAENVGPVRETKYFPERKTGTNIELISKVIN